MSDADRIALRYIEENSYGVTPTSPAVFQALRFTGESFGQDTETSASEELRSDRQRTGVIRTGLTAAGDLNFEMSYGTYDDFLAAVLGHSTTWDTDVIENGTTLTSFSFEREYTDLSNEFEILTGMVANQLSLSIAPGSIITGTFSFQGKDASSATASAAGSTTSATTTAQMNAIDHVTNVQEGGGSTDITQFELNITNNLRPRPQVANLGPIDYGLGTIEVSGTLQKYFASKTLMDKYLNFTTSSLEIVLNDGSNSYTIEIPAIKFTSGRRVAGGRNQDVIADLQWEAFRDSSTGNTIKITRA